MGRRKFLKKSGGATAATAIAWGLTNKATADEGDSLSANLWWVEYKWSAAASIDVQGDSQASAVLVLAAALKKRHEGGAGDYVDSESKPGGSELDPPKYSPITASIESNGNPKFTFHPPVPPAIIGHWTLEFKENYIYRVTHRE